MNPSILRVFIIILMLCLVIPQQANAAAPTPPPPTDPPFPRLGMWWPDLETQPLEDVARYDFVILAPWDEPYLEKLKGLNPRILLLTSTNACELSFDPDDPAMNEDVLAVPSAWFLTQAGSTLRSAIDAETTRIPVKAVSGELDGEEIALFEPGDAALLENETVLVEAVDEEARTLSVQRGYVRPAAAHKAGVRIAAHVTFWPGSWLLNLSTFSPKAYVGYGKETWAEYNARAAARLLANPLWDGILLDRSDPDQSWLVGNSTARSLDADNSNRLTSDLSAFDAAWNAGLRTYESRLRAAAGDGKIIYANWGMANYDLLNGNNFEGFPDDHGGANGTSWNLMTFGPAPNGSYLEWTAQARQPNLSMVETYEEDGGPDPAGDGTYANPAEKPGFKPDYRKMRFGLTTALLGDGYFSYEINTNGHGSLGLLWFDEYDNAGQERGYLGTPLSAAKRVAPALSGENLLTGGGMESEEDLEAWDFWADEESGCSASLSLEDDNPATGKGAAMIDVSGDGCAAWQVSLASALLAVKQGADYTLSLRARADASTRIEAWVQQDGEPWDTRLEFGALDLSGEWRTFEISAPALSGDPAAQLVIGEGKTPGRVWLDDLRLMEGSREVWRRDFSGGIVLVNATSTTQNIPLGGVFHKIDGRQDRRVNDGSRVEEITLPARDGIILLP